MPTSLATSSTPTRILAANPGRLYHPAACPAAHLHHVDKYSTAGGCWFESTLRSSGTTAASTVTAGSGGGQGSSCCLGGLGLPGGGGGQVCWDQTVKYLPDEDDLLTTPDMYSADKSWTRVVNGDGTIVNL